MVRVNSLKRYEYHEFFMRGFTYQLRSALLCPEKTRKRDRKHLPQA